MAERKYKLLRKEAVVLYTTVDGKDIKAVMRRIRAVRDIPRHNVKAGDIGGWVETRKNLSHEGDAWIADEGMVLENSIVKNNALVSNQALVISGSTIRGNAKVYGEARVVESTLYHEATVSEEACISNSHLSGNTIVRGGAIVENYLISGNVTIDGRAKINGVWRSTLADTANVYEGKISSSPDGSIVITDTAEVHASHLQGSGRIDKRAYVLSCTLDGTYHITDGSQFSGTISKAELEASGSVRVSNSDIYGTCVLSGSATVSHSNIMGNNVISEEARIFKGNLGAYTEERDVDGENFISGTSEVRDNAVLLGKNTLTGNSVVFPGHELFNVSLHNQSVGDPSTIAISTTQKNKAKEIVEVVRTGTSRKFELYSKDVHRFKESYDEYINDIVKLIQYPAMSDLSIPETRTLVLALKASERAVLLEDEEELIRAHKSLEEAFLVAENKAHTLALSHLDEAKRKSLKKAGQLLKIASNEASTDNERQVSFRAGIQSLEGVVPVSDNAISLFKQKTGLLELEA